jgi:hypothetical protein
MTKKELQAITDSIVAAVLLKGTEGKDDAYVPTPSEEDQARTLVGMTIRANRQKLIDAVPVVGSL